MKVEAHEEDVEPPCHILQSDRSDLPDHRIEGEGDHRGDTDTLRPRASVEDFGWHDPCLQW